MCERPAVFRKKNIISCKENKQNPWMYLIFPLSPHPTTSVAYIRTDGQMVAISKHACLCVSSVESHSKEPECVLSAQLL